MDASFLAHGGVWGAIAEGAAALVGLGALLFFVWRSTKGKIEEYDPTRERPEPDPPRPE